MQSTIQFAVYGRNEYDREVVENVMIVPSSKECPDICFVVS